MFTSHPVPGLATTAHPALLNGALPEGKEMPFATRHAARDALVRALETMRDFQSLARRSREDRVNPAIDGIAGALLDCIGGPTIDFRGMDSWRAQAAVSLMPPQAWAALHQYAQAAHGQDITAVIFSDSQAGIARKPEFANCMAQLPALAYLELPLAGKRKESFDLAGLGGPGSRLAQVVIRGAFHRCAAELTLPCGVHARALSLDDPQRAGQARVAQNKSVVRHVDIHGKLVGNSHALEGLIYDRSAARDFAQEAARTRRSAQSLAQDVELISTFFLRADDGSDSKMPAVCRHFTWQWLADQWEHSWAIAQAMAKGLKSPRFSFAPFKDAPTLRAHLDQNVERHAEDVIAQGVETMVEPAAFGDELADRLSQMEPGQTALFGVASFNHLMGLKLRVKDKMQGGVLRRQYVAVVYEPGSSATHRRIAVDHPDQLRALSLEHFLGRDQLEQFFGREEKVASFYAFTPAAAGRGNGVRASASVLASPMFLHTSVMLGHDEGVRQSVRAILTLWPKLDSQAIEDRLVTCGTEDFRQFCIDSGKEPRLALEYHGAGVAAYVAEILSAPDEILDAAARKRLIAGAQQALLRTRNLAAIARMMFAMPEPPAHDKLDRLEKAGISTDAVLNALAVQNRPGDAALHVQIRALTSAAA